jgi:transmembrane sensor
MEESVFFALLDKYLKGEASYSEQRLVEEYYSRLEKSGGKSLSEEQEIKLKELMLSNIHDSMDDVFAGDTENQRYKIWRWLPYAAAASIILILATNLLFVKTGDISKHKTVLAKVLPVKGDDVAPGGNKAILTLSDGSKIVLDDVKIGQVVEQAGIKITKSEDGKLIYDVPASYHNESSSGLSYNKIETPKGGQYQINLPDGTKVWLNAASSLKFPTAFEGKERFVELTGEAYFEVSPNKLMPFKVQTEKQTVEVLGTHFNINSYSNESSTKTTLLEGSVKVSNLGSKHVKYLEPGQQAINTNDGNISLEAVNTDQATSWKNGRFIFNDMELESIMRQLERWYNVEVDYSKIPKTSYNAHISMDLNLSKVLEALEVTGSIKFKIEGRTIKILETK